MTDKKFPVVEVFGPTIQGEGAMAGVFTHFIRMGGCDYACWWCDSDHAVLPVHVRKAERLTAAEMSTRLRALSNGPEWVTISGGNPALHELEPLIAELHMRKFKVAVETQGTLWKPWLLQVDQLTVSPKPPSAGNISSIVSIREFLMQGVPPATCLKVPVFDDKDYDYAIRVHEAFSFYPFYFSIVTRMGGLHGDFDGGIIDTKDDILRRYRWLVERAATDPRASDTKAFPQLHALLWGHERGH